MLKWDTKTQSSKGKEILGTVLAFTGADEEQGCKTPHQHWQIWVKELIQTLQDCLFETDATKRKDAQITLCKHIDNVISASYGPNLSITHRCIDEDENEQLKIGIADNLFREKDSTHFRHARHKELYDEVKGGIMYFPDCKQTMSTIDIVNKALQRWKDCLIPSDKAQHNRSDTMIPLSKERLDMDAYTFSYHLNGGCVLETDPFWGNINVRETLLRYRFEEHSFSHSASCFKKDCECRFFFSCLLTVHAFTRIKETRIKIKLCGIFWMDRSTSCIHLWSFQNDPWVVSSSIPTTKQSPRSSILTQTFKSEMHPRFSIAL